MDQSFIMMVRYLNGSYIKIKDIEKQINWSNVNIIK